MKKFILTIFVMLVSTLAFSQTFVSYKNAKLKFLSPNSNWRLIYSGDELVAEFIWNDSCSIIKLDNCVAINTNSLILYLYGTTFDEVNKRMTYGFIRNSLDCDAISIKIKD